MISSVIIDDRSLTHNILKNIIVKNFNNRIQIVANAMDVKSGIAIINRLQPKIVFLDIEFPDGTAFDLLKNINNHGFKLIFVTAFEEYSIQAIRFSALDYLLKPLDEKEIINAIEKAINRISEEEEIIKIKTLIENQAKTHKKIVIKTSDNIFVFETDEILFCKSDNNYTEFYLTDGRKVLTSKTLKFFDGLLSPSHFLRVHKSYLVNIKHIKKVIKGNSWSISLSNGILIPIAQRKKEEVIHALKNTFI